ncbi:hypothetical protein SBRY_30526 [Actinacidiphila bryophytorum]|uniref:Uncharacterized protein n=1 Tax=Actinacidiphila bryophytorum TaxID=1436133 RepID=A0A9W4M9Q4_9ACTN|nr:hypothetical protein SBRY_30526 [Actinacidiphila bryophytorum]
MPGHGIRHRLKEHQRPRPPPAIHHIRDMHRADDIAERTDHDDRGPRRGETGCETRQAAGRRRRHTVTDRPPAHGNDGRRHAAGGGGRWRCGRGGRASRALVDFRARRRRCGSGQAAGRGGRCQGAEGGDHEARDGWGVGVGGGFGPGGRGDDA